MYHLLFFHVRPANQPRIKCVALPKMVGCPCFKPSDWWSQLHSYNNTYRPMRRLSLFSKVCLLAWRLEFHFRYWQDPHTPNHRVKIDTRPHPATYPRGRPTRGASRTGKAAKVRNCPLPPSTAAIKNAWSYTSPPIRLQGETPE